jgi:hypothetical protein
VLSPSSRSFGSSLNEGGADCMSCGLPASAVELNPAVGPGELGMGFFHGSQRSLVLLIGMVESQSGGKHAQQVVGAIMRY